jgi:hypothetical protein
MCLGSHICRIKALCLFSYLVLLPVSEKIGQSSSNGTVVEHLTHHPKAKGLNPTIVASTERENGKKLKLFNQFW